MTENMTYGVTITHYEKSPFSLKLQIEFNRPKPQTPIQTWLNLAKPHAAFAKGMGEKTDYYDSLVPFYHEFYVDVVRNLKLNFTFKKVDDLIKFTHRYPNSKLNRQILDVVSRKECLTKKSPSCLLWADTEEKRSYLCDKKSPGCDCYALVRSGLDLNKAACQRKECQVISQNYIPKAIESQICPKTVINNNKVVACIMNKNLASGNNLKINRGIDLQFCGKNDEESAKKLKAILSRQKPTDPDYADAMIECVMAWCNIL